MLRPLSFARLAYAAGAASLPLTATNRVIWAELRLRCKLRLAMQRLANQQYVRS